MTIYSAALILAQYCPMEGFGWDGFAWWMIPMMVGMILFWGLVILGIVWLVRGGLGLREDGKMSAIEVLERRLAEGELTVEEYRERRDALVGRPDAG
jgi:putative membrane protein